jgi:hypothetical protein
MVAAMIEPKKWDIFSTGYFGRSGPGDPQFSRKITTSIQPGGSSHYDSIKGIAKKTPVFLHASKDW